MYFTLKEPNKDNKTIIYIRYYVKKENPCKSMTYKGICGETGTRTY